MFWMSQEVSTVVEKYMAQSLPVGICAIYFDLKVNGK